MVGQLSSRHGIRCDECVSSCDGLLRSSRASWERSRRQVPVNRDIPSWQEARDPRVPSVSSAVGMSGVHRANPRSAPPSPSIARLLVTAVGTRIALASTANIKAAGRPCACKCSRFGVHACASRLSPEPKANQMSMRTRRHRQSRRGTGIRRAPAQARGQPVVCAWTDDPCPRLRARTRADSGPN
jgi:hypothetical protein